MTKSEYILNKINTLIDLEKEMGTDINPLVLKEMRGTWEFDYVVREKTEKSFINNFDYGKTF